MNAHVECGLSDEALEEYKAKAMKGLARLLDMQESGEVGFMNLPKMDFRDVKEYAKHVKGTFNDLIVIGIGGSSLGLEALCNALLPHGYNTLSYAERGSFPRVWVLDNVDPSKASSIMKECKPEDTLVCVISKSGSTVETAANFSIIYKWLDENLDNIAGSIVAITDPEKGPLRKLVNEKGLKSFVVPDNVGGRFSILSHVGLLPGAILGMDVDKLLSGADALVGQYDMAITLSAIYMYYIDKGFNINVLMPYSERLKLFGDWFCQLWGESLGKDETYSGKPINFGTTPVKVLGAIDQHSQVQLYKAGPADKVITFLEVQTHNQEKQIKTDIEAYKYIDGQPLGELMNIELKATEAAIKNAGRPSVKISVDILDEHTLGELIMLFEYIVPIIGLAYDINPFDQPAVEEGKQYAYGIMEREGFVEMKNKFEGIYVKNDDYII